MLCDVTLAQPMGVHSSPFGVVWVLFAAHLLYVCTVSCMPSVLWVWDGAFGLHARVRCVNFGRVKYSCQYAINL